VVIAIGQLHSHIKFDDSNNIRDCRSQKHISNNFQTCNTYGVPDSLSVTNELVETTQ